MPRPKAKHVKYSKQRRKRLGLLAPPVNMTGAATSLEGSQGGQQSAVDVDKLCQYHFRRGLIVAMDCILRELR